MFGNSGTYGYGNHGAYSSDRGYQHGNEPDQYGNTSYGKQYYEERERMRNEWQGQNSGNSYRNDYGRRDYGRSQLGHNFGSGGTSYQNQGYGSSADNYRSHYDDGSRRQSGNDYRNEGREGQGWWDRTRNQVASWFDKDDNDDRHTMERRQQGSHSGKGPKNYQRSEERIREDICDRLSDDAQVDATGIAVEVQGTDVILTGLVTDKSEKRRAEDIAENIPGVKHVENRIRVDNTGARADSWGNSIGL
jgi:osmotically-inducible protein OsmY